MQEIAKRVYKNESGDKSIIYYMPRRAVIRDDKATTKVG